MLVVISSEAPKKRKIYHKMGCIYAERIKFQNRLEIKVEQAEKEGYCECKYCAGLRGDVRTHKAQCVGDDRGGGAGIFLRRAENPA